MFFSGWSATAQSLGVSVFGLHHPGGYVPPSIDSYLRRPTGTIAVTNVSCLASGLTDAYGIDWTSGATEAGASGSGLFTSNGHYLVGVDSCGSQSCESRHTVYSKFANFYLQIRPYLYSGTPPAPIANPATLVASTVLERIGEAWVARPVIAWMWPPTIRLLTMWQATKI